MIAGKTISMKEIDESPKCRKVGNAVRCECGGQLAISGTVHYLADFGIGFKCGQFVVETKYSNRIHGYTGFCLKCRKQGAFILAK